MDRDAYARWWRDNTDRDGNPAAWLPDSVAALVAHVLALQERIDQLLEPEEHDRTHRRGCRCWVTQCACAYDHPDDVCMVHEAVTR